MITAGFFGDMTCINYALFIEMSDKYLLYRVIPEDGVYVRFQDSDDRLEK